MSIPDNLLNPLNPLNPFNPLNPNLQSQPTHQRTVDPSNPTAEDAALTAAGLVSGERAEVYGNPVDQMESIAALWNAFFEMRDPDRPLTGRDVAMLMMLFKVGREITPNSQPHADHLIDACGYASIAAACRHHTQMS